MFTGTLSAAQVTGRATDLIQTLREAYQEARLLKRDNDAKVAELNRLLEDKLEELASIYLPDIAPATTDAILPLTGYRAFSIKKPKDEMSERRDQLSRRITEIEGDQLYVNRERLVNEVAGELTLARAEAEREKALIDQSVSRFESLQGFQEMINRSYGEPDYSERWYTLQYYRDWKRGDEIEDSFATRGEDEKIIRPSFSDLVYQYRQVKGAAAGYKADLNRINGEIGGVNGLVSEREEALRSLNTLSDDVLTNARSRLLEHVRHADRADLAERAKDRPDIIAALKHIEGLEKKVEYLEALERQYIDANAQALLERVDSLQKKVEKYSRPKNRTARIPASDAERWLKDPTPKLRQRWGRYRASQTTIYNFNRYDDYDFFRNYLWWDLMTDGRLDGDFIPEVSDYRTSNPAAPSAYQFADTGLDSTSSPALSEVDFS